MVSGVFSIPLSSSSGDSAASAAHSRRSKNATENRLTAFFGGGENRLVQAAVEELLRSSNPPYNPLVLCGPSGSGKSLLAGGIAGRWTESPAARAGEVFCLEASAWAEEFARRRAPRRLAAWREHYRGASLVVLDHLDALPTSRAVAHELARLIDALTAIDGKGRHGQLIVTMRDRPEATANLSSDVAARLSGGLVVPLASAGSEARRALILASCEKHELTLSDSALEYLAAGTEPPMAELPALVERLARRVAAGQIGDLDLVREFAPRGVNRRTVRIDRVARCVARYYQLSVADLKSSSRRRNVAVARRTLIYFAREVCGKSFARIGAFLGGRDHTTVLYNYGKICELQESDPATRLAIAEIQRKLLA